MEINTQTSSIGVVIIGRNEGERLIRCITSLIDQVGSIVYVDSGSTDGSVTAAQSLGVHVVELDLTQPFTAARARNAGFEHLQTISNIEYVQFVDGDCEVVRDWIDTAQNHLINHPQTAVVCGRRRERFPEKSVYNMLCDIEWDTPIGTALACGGDAMMRTDVFSSMKGYNPALIAGEEPELCARMRAAGWQIERLDAEMTLHDAAIYHFSQWWKRAKRAGFAFTRSMLLHKDSAETRWQQEVRRIVLWGALLPLIILIAGAFDSLLLSALLLYPLQILRIASREQKNVISWKKALQYAFYNMLGKFPQLLGVVNCISDQMFNRQSKIIEYK